MKYQTLKNTVKRALNMSITAPAQASAAPDRELDEAYKWYVEYTREHAASGNEDAEAWLKANPEKVRRPNNFKPQ